MDDDLDRDDELERERDRVERGRRRTRPRDEDFPYREDNPERGRWRARSRDKDFFDRKETIAEQNIEEDIRDLRTIREENLDVLGDLMAKYKEIRDIHLEVDDLIEEYYEFMDAREVSGRITDEYSELLDDHIKMLDEQEDEKQRGTYSRFAGGTGLLATGLGLAHLYLPEEGFIDFYQGISEVAAESPEVAFTATALPVAGLYTLKKSLEKQAEYKDLREEKQKYELKRDNLEEP